MWLLLYEHEFVRDRMHPDRSHLAETYIKTKWCSFNWETQDDAQNVNAQNVNCLSHPITEQNFFVDELAAGIATMTRRQAAGIAGQDAGIATTIRL